MDFSVFNYLVYGSETILTILVESHLGIIPVKFDWNWLRDVGGQVLKQIVDGRRTLIDHNSLVLRWANKGTDSAVTNSYLYHLNSFAFARLTHEQVYHFCCGPYSTLIVLNYMMGIYQKRVFFTTKDKLNQLSDNVHWYIFILAISRPRWLSWTRRPTGDQ